MWLCVFWTAYRFYCLLRFKNAFNSYSKHSLLPLSFLIACLSFSQSKLSSSHAAFLLYLLLPFIFLTGTSCSLSHGSTYRAFCMLLNTFRFDLWVLRGERPTRREWPRITPALAPTRTSPQRGFAPILSCFPCPRILCTLLPLHVSTRFSSCSSQAIAKVSISAIFSWVCCLWIFWMMQDASL
jgi:hypothetical protein